LMQWRLLAVMLQDLLQRPLTLRFEDHPIFRKELNPLYSGHTHMCSIPSFSLLQRVSTLVVPAVIWWNIFLAFPCRVDCLSDHPNYFGLFYYILYYLTSKYY
jgi:hypothetical protein